ncbi:transposase-like protein DUF772 [Nitrosomonas ureae]|uniref:Transposase-like protein DUF772 n=2 Tax=Nitrosomonas ureae TaxID=44577 RepID=A0A2T5IBP6_9PROT|nr:transposase-like protein DUF772 [Nitrosomonas ureae]
MQMSFGTLELAERLKRENVLVKIDALIEWEDLRPKLTGLYKRELSHGGGQEPFDGLLMFKAILLGQWHSLSDAALEQALCVRIVCNFADCPCRMRYRTKPLCAGSVTD